MNRIKNRLRRHAGLTATSRPDLFRFPPELRNQIYEECLVSHTQALHPWLPHRFPRHKLAVGLFGVSKVIRREAARVFYGQNLIDFTMMKPDEIAGFLKRIGRNADYIRHLVVSFPRIFQLELQCFGRIRINPKDVAVMAVIRQGCPSLQTIRTGHWTTEGMVHDGIVSLEMWYLKEWSMPGHRIVAKEMLTEAIGLLDAHLRGFPSLQQVTLELDEKTYCPPLTRSQIARGHREEYHMCFYVLGLMNSHGWTLDPREMGCDEDFELLYIGRMRRTARTRLLCDSTPDHHKDEYYLSMF